MPSRGALQWVTCLQATEPFVRLAKKSRGIIDDVSGDKVAVSFNTTIPATSHRGRAVDLYFLLRSEWDRKAAFQVNAAVATGPVTCGNIGCAGMKKYAVLGNAPLAVRTLERCGRSWGLPLVCDNAVAGDINTRYITRVLVLAQVSGQKAALLFAVEEKPESEDGEWMYQLDKADRSNPHKAANDAILLVFQGNVSEASAAVRAAGLAPDSHAGMLVARAVRSGVPPPVRLNEVPSMMPAG